LPQRTPDHIQHRICPEQHIVIPESQHTIPSFIQPKRATPVVLNLLHMLTTIQLDNQPALEATEVNNKTLDTMLPAKPIAKLPTAKAIPKPDLRIGSILAKQFDVIHKSPGHKNIP
jgi:hypothetical protein